jgi:hypothetical protein
MRKSFYDVCIEYVREDIITVEADNADEAMAAAQEAAETDYCRDDEEVRVVAVSVNLESPPF